MQTVWMILRSREARAVRQKEWLLSHGLPLVSFTLNIPGAQKQSALYQRIHEAGQQALLRRISVTACQILHPPSGSEAIFACPLEARELKRIAMSVEETHPLGRIFDMDVVGLDGKSLSRRDFGAGLRRCLVCDRDAIICARRQSHPLPMLLERIAALARDYFNRKSVLS